MAKIKENDELSFKLLGDQLNNQSNVILNQKVKISSLESQVQALREERAETKKLNEKEIAKLHEEISYLKSLIRTVQKV